MSMLAEEESANVALVSNVQAQLTTPTAVVPPPVLPPPPGAQTNAAAIGALVFLMQMVS